MPAKSIVSGIILIIMALLVVCLTEYFMPLSVKADLDMLCRNALLNMENAGGLDSDARQALRSELEEIGLTNIVIVASSGAKQGGMLTLHVEADYVHDRMTSLFRRGETTLRMVYEKTTMSRKVVN